MELESTEEKIREYEHELERLEMRAAEGNLPLAEAEYRLLVAETWDTDRGHPNVTGEARVEMARLRLGILPGARQRNRVRDSYLTGTRYSIANQCLLYARDLL
jgi:hypothetical protein